MNLWPESMTFKAKPWITWNPEIHSLENSCCRAETESCRNAWYHYVHQSSKQSYNYEIITKRTRMKLNDDVTYGTSLSFLETWCKSGLPNKIVLIMVLCACYRSINTRHWPLNGHCSELNSASILGTAFVRPNLLRELISTSRRKALTSTPYVIFAWESLSFPSLIGALRCCVLRISCTISFNWRVCEFAHVKESRKCLSSWFLFVFSCFSVSRAIRCLKIGT